MHTQKTRDMQIKPPNRSAIACMPLDSSAFAIILNAFHHAKAEN